MTQQVIPKGWHCRNLPTGEYAVHIPNQHVLTHLGPIPFESANRQPLFLDLTANPFKMAGQSWLTGDDRVVEYTGAWAVLGSAPGVSPIIYDLTGTLRFPTPQTGSQGYRYVEPNGTPVGRLVTGDETYAPANGHDLNEWTELPCGLVIGQRGVANDELQVWDGQAHRRIPELDPQDNTKVKHVSMPHCRFAHAVQGAQIAISCYRLTDDGSAVKDAVLTWATEAELRALPEWVAPSLPPDKPIGPLGPSLPVGTTVDLSPFFAIDNRCWPRGDKTRGDTHGMDMQRVPSLEQNGDVVWQFAKFDKDGQGKLGEILSMDAAPDGWIHLRADWRALLEVDTWTDTGWLRKIMTIGETITIQCERVWFHPVTGAELGRENYWKNMTLLHVWEKYWGGADAGQGRCAEYQYNVERYRVFIGDDGRVWSWGDWDYTDPHTSVVAYSRFWLKGGQRFPVVLPNCPLSRAIIEVPAMNVPDHSSTVHELFATDAFNLTTKDGCGIFTDAVARALHERDPRWGHLIKKPGQNQYDTHAVDAVLYKSDTPGQSVAVDIISASETPEAKPGWGEDIPRYSPADWRDPGPQPMSKVQRPALAFMAGMTGFDWGTHRDQGWLDLHTTYKLPVIRIVPQSVYRTPRTLAEGIAQLDQALAILKAQGRKALVVINCDTKDFGMDRDAVRANTTAINAVMVKHLPAVAAASLCNENQNGNEQIWMTDPFFLLELDGLVDARIPLAWGCMFGRDVSPVAAGGSWIAHHSDRGLSPDENGKIMAAAQQKFGKPVVDQEPLGLAEPGTPGQRTYDSAYGQQLGAAAKQYKLGGLIYHTQAGLRASVAEFGTVHRAGAVALVEGLGGTVVTPPGPTVPPVAPPTGHPILDVDLRGKTTDALSDPGYILIVSKRKEVEAEAVKWYTKSRGHKPADSDVAVMVYVRGVAERDRWHTFRAAWEQGWPGGAAA